MEQAVGLAWGREPRRPQPASDGAETSWTKAAIEAELARLAPFHHDIALPHGLRTYRPEASRRLRERTRLHSLRKLVWPKLLDPCRGSLRRLRVVGGGC